MADPLTKVFIVDDDVMFASMLSGALTNNKSLRIFHFATGESCLAEMYQGPDIVILDYTLNSVHKDAADGLQILEKLKKANPNVHVIFLSSQTHYGIAARTIQKGAEQYVIKDETALTAVRDIIEEIVRSKN